MGILDEAIREHLDLKRKHGADESELKGLEDEAFGPADRPDATGSAPAAEAETRVISPGAAGEGDQLDKVFERTRQAEEAAAKERAGSEEPAASAESPEAPADEPVAEATFAEHPVPKPPAPAGPKAQPEAGSKPESDSQSGSRPDITDAATVESPEAKPAEPAPEPEEGDAGDLLEAERHHLASHPTEHYDVDAAIAEEDEIDILSESSLSDELDRALDDGEAPAPEPTGTVPPASDEEPAAEGPAEPETDESAVSEPDTGEDSAELLYEDAAAEDQPVEGEPGTGAETAGQGDFFDQDDVLEATPDFLEETPEHDQLWFEQKQPKDFDFGD